MVTSSTLSSSNIFKKFKLKKTIHKFYPIDRFFFVNRFLEYWRPNAAIFIESEIWPYMFKKIEEKNIPLILLNARLTKKTFNRWMKIKIFSTLIFNKISIAYPQNLETRKYLNKLNVKKVNLLGNIKFSENYLENQNGINRKLNLALNNKKVWTASSTHRDEEIFCIKAHLELKKKVKNLLTIIIPRHIHRVKEIIPEIKKFNLKFKLHSHTSQSLENIDIYIVDTFGETRKFHKLSSSVFLGGSVIKRGGQNPLEAARFGAKILHGPNTDNFRDVYKLLKKLNISKKINTPKQLASSIIFIKKKQIGIKIKKIGERILKKTIRELDNLIDDEFKKT